MEIEIKRQAATRLRTMIANLEREVANLEESIGSELAMTRLRDLVYPGSARTRQARQENLKASIAALSERLTLTFGEFGKVDQLA